ncbi:hypothetical protein [Haladaptatus cibarius]|uniref:hypothetical protein n=1 Tax=Haladaptatus cibarius TaxID=453847 RepID=UPI000679AF5E|nr:hypothetical protein [Haladaptatus cibarius]
MIANGSEDEPAVRSGWQFRVSESVYRYSPLRDKTSGEIASATLLTNPKHRVGVRWKTLEEKGFGFASDFKDVDFDDGEFLTLVEILLPESRELEFSDTKFEGGVMTQQYDVVDSDTQERE